MNELNSEFNQADVALIGGTVNERLIYATKLRRLNFATYYEFAQSKKDKMFKRACNENKWGKGGVYDLDNPEDREWLDREDLDIVGL